MLGARWYTVRGSMDSDVSTVMDCVIYSLSACHVMRCRRKPVAVAPAACPHPEAVSTSTRRPASLTCTHGAHRRKRPPPSSHDPLKQRKPINVRSICISKATCPGSPKTPSCHERTYGRWPDPHTSKRGYLQGRAVSIHAFHESVSGAICWQRWCGDTSLIEPPSSAPPEARQHLSSGDEGSAALSWGADAAWLLLEAAAALLGLGSALG